MKITAEQIAEVLNGVIVGDSTVEVFKLSKIEEGDKGSITFLSNLKYKHFLYTTEASVVIVNKDLELTQPVKATMIQVDDSYSAFTKILEYANQIKLMKSGIEQPSVISEGVEYGDDLYLGSFCYIGKNTKIGNNVKIYPNSFVGDNVIIGDNTILFAGARIYSESVIGKNCVIHSGTIIGSDGFGFAPNSDGTYAKIPQIGNVIIEDDVEIGSCTTVDRATLGSTIIRKGVKLDNQIQIAHNVEVGEHTVIASQTGIAGSTKVGKNCVIGGQVGIVGHITIGDNVRVQAQTGVGKSIKDGEIIQGSPAMAYNDFTKSYIYFKKLPNIVKDIEELKKNKEN
ncbi:UDP-3-O-(3-hydroxymyristoyl)glucosamine N-acyltransferase [Flavobacterium dauae]|uniref:UDP-3-O-(3-hydroxymyristoyl)glucosamine N-acyltransferase n=1 Tax=Flavobacterium dauae TaxID=1563479 RepID=UPI00101B31EC|nr:UDP-3-O-(3-hydroxymyristoyl)glucosamine N-acyltransferase [Flavobacterium dauae]WLD24879.1 UDP-3-O-(3-hydroxymyristoyl)glucosamine N-acyltransferase [Flavobacterium dauae]